MAFILWRSSGTKIVTYIHTSVGVLITQTSKLASLDILFEHVLKLNPARIAFNNKEWIVKKTGSLVNVALWPENSLSTRPVFRQKFSENMLRAWNEIKKKKLYSF